MSEARPQSSTHVKLTRPIEGSEQFYNPNKDELQFLKELTGIADEAELKAHVVEVQREAYNVHAYPCIYRFSFTRLTLASLSAYSRVLELGKSRKNPVLLDVGCCFGNDVRKAIMDGFPMESVVCTDLLAEFWALGHRLFKTTPETYPVTFIAGDIFDQTFLEVIDPIYTTPTTVQVQKLSALTSLSPLRGYISVISICNVFHLFDTAEAHTQLARALACLLSPEPGSMIVGTQAARPEPGLRIEKRGMDSLDQIRVFYHSPESWEALWNGEIFRRGTVQVEARLEEFQVDSAISGKIKYWFMDWSVTRL